MSSFSITQIGYNSAVAVEINFTEISGTLDVIDSNSFPALYISDFVTQNVLVSIKRTVYRGVSFYVVTYLFNLDHPVVTLDISQVLSAYAKYISNLQEPKDLDGPTITQMPEPKQELIFRSSVEGFTQSKEEPLPKIYPARISPSRKRTKNIYVEVEKKQFLNLQLTRYDYNGILFAINRKPNTSTKLRVNNVNFFVDLDKNTLLFELPLEKDAYAEVKLEDFL